MVNAMRCIPVFRVAVRVVRFGVAQSGVLLLLAAALSTLSVGCDGGTETKRANGPPPRVHLMKPYTDGWTDSDISPFGDVVLKDQKLRIRVKLDQAVQQKSDITVEITFDNQTWQPLTLKDADALVDAGKELRVSVPWADMLSQGWTADGEDAVPEQASADSSADPPFDETPPESGDYPNNPWSNRADSDAFDGCGLASTQRGKARGPGNETLWPPESVINKQFLASAGVVYCKVRATALNATGFANVPGQLQNQADWFYYSGHGFNRRYTGDGVGRLFAADAQNGLAAADAKWSPDVKHVIIAGCSMININDPNRDCSACEDDGILWAQTGPTHIAGYNWTAPLDNVYPGPNNYTAQIVNHLCARLGDSEPFPTAWLNANADMDPGRDHVAPSTQGGPGRVWNAAAIDLSGGPGNGVYYYWDIRTDPRNPQIETIPQSQW